MLNYLFCDFYLLRSVLQPVLFLYSFVPYCYSFTVSPLSIVLKLTWFSYHQDEGRYGSSDGETIVKRGIIVRRTRCWPRDPKTVSCWDLVGCLLVMDTFTRFMLRGATCLVNLCHTLLLFLTMHTLTPNEQCSSLLHSVEAVLLRIANCSGRNRTGYPANDKTPYRVPYSSAPKREKA